MTMIRLEKEGYAPYITSFSRDEQLDAGALIGGLLITVPLLWTMKYNPVHSYELQPVDFQNQTVQSPVNASQKNYAADELTKLKDLLDRQAITKNDFSSLKEKILNERYDYSKDIPGRIAELKSLLDSELLTPEEYNSQKDKLVSGG